MTTEKLFVFGCEESYFFRGGNPFIAGEDNSLASCFPPSCLVMQGAIRTAILNGHGADFQMYHKDKCSVCGTSVQECSVLRTVGKAGRWDDMELDFSGPFLVRHSKGATERFYPAPYDLARLVDDKKDSRNEKTALEIGRLQPLTARMTDLGRVLLPAAEGKSSRPIQGAWISEQGLLSYLKGENVAPDQLQFPDDPADDRFKNSGFLKRERRIGIARQAATRNTEKGMYYAVEHLRLANDFALGERVRGLPDIALPGYIKLGGEGRMTTLTMTNSSPLPEAGIAEAITQNGRSLFDEYCFKITFLTPARFDDCCWIPREFTEDYRKGLDGEELKVWRGRLEGIECTIVSLCADRPERIGGWDLAKHRPKPRYSYLPAGSVIYLTSPHSGKEIVMAMHDRKLGLDTKVGFGQAVIGRW